MAKADMANKDEATKTAEPLAEGAPPAPLTEEQVREKRAALMEQLASLPPEESVIAGLQPGEIVNKGTPNELKVPWTWDHLRKKQAAGDYDFREVTFAPAYSGKIGWNGLFVDLNAGVEITTFGVFFGEYQQSMRERSTNDRIYPPLRADEKPAMPGEQTRAHRMGFGGLDPRGPGTGGAPPAAAA